MKPVYGGSPEITSTVPLKGEFAKEKINRNKNISYRKLGVLWWLEGIR